MTTTQTPNASTIVKQLLAGTSDLPVLPELAIKLMEELRAPNVTAARIAQYVKKDPVLATAVLRVANSALYGGRAQVTDLAFAMTRIGLMQTRNLVLALVLRSKMSDTNVYGKLGAQVMDHSLAVAFGARLVAEGARVDADDAFLCGLLHDFGKLALVKAIRESQDVREFDLNEDQLLLIEQHHAEAGALLAARWGLPELVTCVIRDHHRPEAPGAPQPTTSCVALANAAAHRLGLGSHADPRIDLGAHPGNRALHLTKEQLDALCDHLPGLFETARGAMTS